MGFTSASLIGIIGAGSMGAGIAQVAAEAGHRVLVYDANPPALKRAQSDLEALFEKLVAKQKRSRQEAADTLGRLHFVDTLAELSDCALVIEAIVEDLTVKQDLFRKLSGIVRPDCVLASNTSSLSITALASACTRPERFLGLHFFNPAPLMKLVEVVPAMQTKTSLVEEARDLMRDWGKTPVITRDTPGFIVNRVARPYYSEALRIYEEGIARPEDIDRAMEERGFRMGPFTLTDFIGHDVNFAVTESMFHAYWGEPRYRPSFAQQRLVNAGYLGRKAGRGFYTYGEDRKPQRPESECSPEQRRTISDRILAVLINEAADALHFGIASEQDIDLAMQRGVNYPKGLLAWAREIGPKEIIARLDDLFDYYHEARYRVSPGLRRL